MTNCPYCDSQLQFADIKVESSCLNPPDTVYGVTLMVVGCVYLHEGDTVLSDAINQRNLEVWRLNHYLQLINSMLTSRGIASSA